MQMMIPVNRAGFSAVHASAVAREGNEVGGSLSHIVLVDKQDNSLAAGENRSVTIAAASAASDLARRVTRSIMSGL